MAKKSIEKNAVELEKLYQDYLELKLKHSSMALKETHKLSEARKDIARLKTAMNKKLEVEKSE
jgi:ribosomal protein L29